METVDALTSFQDLTVEIAGQPFGSWQFWTVWGAGLALVLLFGKVFARGIGKSEKPLITVFIGNVLIAISMLAAAWAVLTYAAPHLDDPFVVTLLASLAAGLDGFFLSLLLGPVFWAESRGASLLACVFALSIGYAAMYSTDKLLDAFAQGQGTVEKQRAPVEDSLEEATK